MKTQIKRLSPHQNGKVFGILMALTSLVFIVPMVLLLAAAAPAADQGASSIGFPFAMMLFMPVIYLITTYIAVALGSVLYNFLVRYIGGIEYEAEQEG